MIIVISPAKSLDFETPAATALYTQPTLLAHSQQLIDQLKQLSPQAIESLMNISTKLALLNMQRFSDWQQPFTPENAKPALLAFTGDVYQGMNVGSFQEQDFHFAQQHLRILSGLYGVLKPLDLMQAYRLEMGTAFANARGKNLYEFWGDIITDTLNHALSQQNAGVLVNLASNEYFSAVNTKRLNAQVITPIFKDYKNGQYKIISFNAKKARGMMAAFIIKNQLDDVQAIKNFAQQGYQFSDAQSSDSEWVFLRKQ